MGVRVKFDILPEIVRPKLDDLDVTTISFEEMLLPNKVVSSSDALRGTGSEVPQNAAQTDLFRWQSWTFNLSLSNIKSVNDFVLNLLKEIDRINKQVIQLLRIVRFFSSDLKSISTFLKFLLKQMVKQMRELIDSLTSTGVYVSLVLPDIDRSHPKYTIPIYGGYQEFIKRVNFVCQNSADPDAPRFRNRDDRVGGVIIAMLGGTEDPEFLNNVINNYRVLSGFFQFKAPVPNPPKNFKVMGGLYKNKAHDNKFEPGMLLSWEAPDTIVTDYWVYRVTDVKGKPEIVKEKGVSTQISVPQIVTKMKHIPGKKYYRYYDFTAEVDITYFYKVYCTVGDKFFEDNPTLRSINSPIATQYVKGTVKTCIDVSEIDKYTNTGINGELLSPFDMAGDWQSFTVRRMLSAPIDDAFRILDGLADKLSGYVSSASSDMSKYLDFCAKRIERLIDSIEVISETIDRVNAFNLRGTFMVLNLPILEGGMDGFVERFNMACQTSTTETGLKTGKDNPFSIDQGGGIARYTDQGIMLGIVLLYGIPGKASLSDFVPEQQKAALQEQLKQTEKAINVFLKMLGLKKE